MTSIYNQEGIFGIHTDTGLYYNDKDKIYTTHTLLIYLNDDFEGGTTVFYDSNFKITDTIIPKKGSCLIFDISLFHKGSVVSKGSKYWIGCELIGPKKNKWV